MNIVMARPKSVVYKKASTRAEPSFSRQRPGNAVRRGLHDKGNGWAYSNDPASLEVIVERTDKQKDNKFFLEKQFRELLGKLTSKRVKALQATMPAEIALEIYEGNDGRRIRVTDAALQQWAAAAKAKLERK